ncbi:hypothetical protein [Methylobacterium sp. A54F]
MLVPLRRPLTAAGLLLLPLLQPPAALAALPPSWERVRAFQAVLEAAARVLGDRPIDAVERTEDGRFHVRAGGCRVAVRLVDRPRAGPGPRAFEAVPDAPDCP